MLQQRLVLHGSLVCEVQLDAQRPHQLLVIDEHHPTIIHQLPNCLDRFRCT